VNYTEDKNAALLIEQRANMEAAWKRWLTKHPDVKDCVANRNIVFEYINDAFGFEDDSEFDFVYSNIKDRLAHQRVPTEAETKAALIDKIIALTSKDGVSRGTTFQLVMDGGKRVVSWSIPQLAGWNITQLTELLDEIVRKQTLVAKPTTELQKMVESGRTYVGYPALPKMIVRPGTVRAVPLDAAYLKNCDAYDLKKFMRLYGADAVNARLAGKEN